MENETFLLLKMHECAEGVEEDAIRDIAHHAELERHGPDDVIHRAEDVMTQRALVNGLGNRCTRWLGRDRCRRPAVPASMMRVCEYPVGSDPPPQADVDQRHCGEPFSTRFSTPNSTIAASTRPPQIDSKPRASSVPHHRLFVLQRPGAGSRAAVSRSVPVIDPMLFAAARHH
jgi:hypothetical protein